MGKVKNAPNGNANGRGSQETVEAPVRECSSAQYLDNKIFVLDGTNSRKLRDGRGLCSPGIIVQDQRIRQPLRNAVRRSLLDICHRNILTSEVIMRNRLTSVLTEHFLDKGRKN